jgi:hypothetical protein
MHGLNASTRERALDSYDLSFVHEKLLSDGRFAAKDLVKIEHEFKRFMKLVLSEPGPLAMIDRRVDELWHHFILFTPQYQQFCEQVMGFFVHHQPRTSMTPVPERAIKNFVDAYKSRYGKLDSFWLEQLEPDVRSIIASGSVPSSLTLHWSGWTSRPGHSGTSDCIEGSDKAE